MKRMLIQTQLSNYTADGLFVLECDSGWQMAAGRMRELLKLVPDLNIDVMGPKRNQIVTQPEAITPEFREQRVRYIEHYIPPNALLSRHHFDVREMNLRQPYDVIYLNDPMQFRNYRAKVKSKLFVVHNHFIDNPSCPKFPVENTLWYGQCEAVQRACLNFWQCESALAAFEGDFGAAAPKSAVWDDGYSVTEIQAPINLRNVRFDPKVLKQRPIIFVPNRVGGRGRSSDYTNCGRFLFEVLPQLRSSCGNTFNVVAGNPSQKFSNKELVTDCGVLPLVEDTLTRDEYKLVAANTTIVVALYDKDTYGGTAVRECIELGALPLWLDCNEYRSISLKANYSHACTWNTIVEKAAVLLEGVYLQGEYQNRLQAEVRSRCSFEATTKAAAERMGLL